MRVLAREHRVSKNTVKRAYEELAQQGLIVHGSGESFIVASLTDEERQAVSVYRPMGYESQLNAIQSLSRELVSAFDGDLIRSLFVDKVKSALRTPEVHIALADADGRCFELRGPEQSGCPAFETDVGDPLLDRLSKMDFPALLQAGSPDGGPDKVAPASPLHRELESRGTSVVYPLKDRSRLLGLVALGRRAAGAPYTEESLNLLMVLANQFVTALVTSRLYVESLEKRRVSHPTPRRTRKYARMIRICRFTVPASGFAPGLSGTGRAPHRSAVP